MRTREKFAVTLALLACAVTFLVLATRLSSIAAVVPFSIALATAVLIAAQLTMDWRNNAAPSAPGSTAEPSAKERSIALSILALLAALYLLGFAIALPMYAGLEWRTRASGSWAGALAIAGGLFTFLYGGLVWLLHMELFTGILWDWFTL